MLARSVVAVGVCANATDTSNADAAKAAGIYFTDIWFLPDIRLSGENTLPHRPFQLTARIFRLRRTIITWGTSAFWRGVRSEAAPIGRNTVVAMQLGLLRAIAPVEILVGAERWRAS